MDSDNSQIRISPSFASCSLSSRSIPATAYFDRYSQSHLCTSIRLQQHHYAPLKFTPTKFILYSSLFGSPVTLTVSKDIPSELDSQLVVTAPLFPDLVIEATRRVPKHPGRRFPKKKRPKPFKPKSEAGFSKRFDLDESLFNATAYGDDSFRKEVMEKHRTPSDEDEQLTLT